MKAAAGAWLPPGCVASGRAVPSLDICWRCLEHKEIRGAGGGGFSRGSLFLLLASPGCLGWKQSHDPPPPPWLHPLLF